MTKHKPSEYKHIRAWGRMMGSYDYYIRDQQAQAAADGAPLDAIYKREEGWRTFADVTREETKRTLEGLL